ncbi:MAG: hypothetical protein AB7N24_19810 [Dehalococcoidia bacterium]
MAEAVVFGGSNGLVSKLADGLADILGVRVRYQRSGEESALAGVAIATNAEAFTGDSLLVYADDEKPKTGLTDSSRAMALGQVAEEIARGRVVAVLSSRTEAKRWLDLVATAGAGATRPLRRMNICGESGTGKTTLASKLAGPLGIPMVSIDDIYWGDHTDLEHGEFARSHLLEDVLAREEWLAEGPYWRSAFRLSSLADCTIYLEYPSHRVARQKHERGDSPFSWRERLAVSTAQRIYPKANERRIHTKLSEIAHLTPVLDVRNDAELEAVTAGMLRGAGRRNDRAGSSG